MQRIPITLATPDMILEQFIMPPNKANGIPLFGKGRPLTAQIIERLKNLGIQTIAVAGHPINIPGEETLDQALAAIDDRFATLQDDPYMMNMLALFKKHIRQGYDETP